MILACFEVDNQDHTIFLFSLFRALCNNQLKFHREIRKVIRQNHQHQTMWQVVAMRTNPKNSPCTMQSILFSRVYIFRPGKNHTRVIGHTYIQWCESDFYLSLIAPYLLHYKIISISEQGAKGGSAYQRTRKDIV